MKTQRAREEQTLTIATALVLFVVVVVAAAVLSGSVAAATGGRVGETVELATAWAVAPAALAAVAYLVRHRR